MASLNCYGCDIPALVLMGAGLVGFYASILVAAVASLRAARMLESAGIRVSRRAGILGVIFGVLSSVMWPLSLICSRIQMAKNLRVAERAGIHPRRLTAAPAQEPLFIRFDERP